MVTSLVNVTWKPNRVIIDDDGHAVPAIAAERMGMNPDVIFVREDGWSLGAPKQFEDIARNMWLDDWSQFIRLGETNWRDISEYPRFVKIEQ